MTTGILKYFQCSIQGQVSKQKSIPVKKSSKPLPVDEKVDERTREHFFSKHLLNATEQSQVENKTEKTTNQGKNHPVTWTKHVSVVLPKSKKGLQKKREQIKSVRSAAVKRE